MFDKTSISLGTIKVSKEIKFQYNYTDEVDLITRIQSPCDCSNVYHNIDLKAIVVKYIPNAIPVHLAREGKTSYNIAKQINVELRTKSDPGNIHTIGLMFDATVTL